MEKHPTLAAEFMEKYFRKRDNANKERNSQEATPPGEKESQTQPIDNGSQDSQPQSQSQSVVEDSQAHQPIGNEGGDTQLQSQVEDSQPTGNGGEESQTEPQA